VGSVKEDIPLDKDLINLERTAQFDDARILSAQRRDPNVDQDYVSLATYWHMLLRRRWTVLSVMCVLTTLTAIGTFKSKPVYKAVAHVNVEADTPAVQTIADLYQQMYADNESFLQTQIQVLKSDNLAWRTIANLGLAQDPSFDPEKIGNDKKMSANERKLQLINQFKSQLSVELIPKTHMLVVGVESSDPELAARTANTLVSTYIDYSFRDKYDTTRQASGFMEQQLDELKAKVEKSQQVLVDYERQNSMFNTGEKQNVQEQMLSDLSRDLTAAQSDRMQKESLYNQVRSDRSQMALLVHNDLLQKLEEQGAALKGQYTEALGQYGPNFPKVMRIAQQVNENQTQIEKEQNRVLDRISNDYATASNREALAIASVARQKEELGKFNQLLVQHNILQREFEANQQLYQSLMQRLKEATVSAGLRSTNIHLVDAALTPSAPVRPKKVLNIATGLLAGLILGMMSAFLQESLDHSVKSLEEVESLIAVPALGMIPLDTNGRSPYGLLKKGNGVTPANEAGEVALTVLERPTSVLAEAYRSLRTALLLSVAGHPPKILLVTSAQSGEGKTATALNLAQALAQRKGPVLLIDCDLRKAGIARVLKVGNDKGVSTVLTGSHELDEALQQYEAMPNLWVLPSGPIPPNPADLLSSEKMAELLKNCEQRFEHVVIDSPPVLAVADATILAGMADGVILIAAGGSTPKGALIRMHKTIAATGARVLGIALNKCDMRHAGYYDGQYYYYYGYGKKDPYYGPHESNS
jgi:polysaccharide biosynthesis transport protein